MKLHLFSGEEFSISWAEGLEFILPIDILDYLDEPKQLMDIAITLRNYKLLIDTPPFSARLPLGKGRNAFPGKTTLFIPFISVQRSSVSSKCIFN